MLKGKQFIYCADAGLGSYNIRKFNSMGGRAFVITQSIKKLPDTLKESVFNDCDYRLLSNDSPVSLKTMQEFDKNSNKRLYEDRAYKIIDASRDLEMEHYEEKILKNGKKKMVRAKGHLKQKNTGHPLMIIMKKTCILLLLLLLSSSCGTAHPPRGS